MRNDGLTDHEGKVRDSLVEAWNTFLKLQENRDSDINEFNQGIQQCRLILRCRSIRRDYLKGYPSHKRRLK